MRNKKKEKTTKEKRNVVFNCIIAVFLIMFIFNVARCMKEITYSTSRCNDLSTFNSYLSDGDYTKVFEYKAENQVSGYEPRYSVDGFLAVGEYYRYSVLAEAYGNTGDIRQCEEYRRLAAQCKDRMDHYVQRLHAERIDEKYGKSF